MLSNISYFLFAVFELYQITIEFHMKTDQLIIVFLIYNWFLIMLIMLTMMIADRIHPFKVLFMSDLKN